MGDNPDPLGSQRLVTSYRLKGGNLSREDELSARAVERAVR